MGDKLILVGEAPGGEIDLSDREWMSLTGGAAKQLCQIAGWDWDTFLRDTQRMNLFYAPQKTWDYRQAARNASVLSEQFRNQRVILLGQKVAHAFEAEDIPLYAWRWKYDGLVARVPHPSGRNRMWNSESERKRANKFLRDLI